MLFSMIGTALVSSLLTARGEVGEIWPLTLAPSHSLAVAESPGGQGQTLVGTIVGFGEADEHEWLVQTSRGVFVADAGPRWFQVIDLAIGERVTMTGRWDGNEFDVVAISRADGRQIVTGRPLQGPPPWAGGPDRHRRSSQEIGVASPQRGGQTLVGTIVGFGEADEHEWLVQTSQGLVVVDGGSRHRQLVDLPLGEQVSFLGEFDGGEFDAFSLRRANGTVIAFPHDD